jgi:hypothetical protein
MTPSGFGVGIPHQCVEDYGMDNAAILRTLRPPWWYDWKYQHLDDPLYVPMVWKMDVEWLAAALPTIASNVDRLWMLGNEPERQKQSNTMPDVFANAVNYLRSELGDWAVEFAVPGVLWDELGYGHGVVWMEEYERIGGYLPDTLHFHLYNYTARHIQHCIGTLRRKYPNKRLIISECAGAVNAANGQVMDAISGAIKKGDIQAAAWFSAYYEKWHGPDLLDRTYTLTDAGMQYVGGPRQAVERERHTTYMPGVSVAA